MFGRNPGLNSPAKSALILNCKCGHTSSSIMVHFRHKKLINPGVCHHLGLNQPLLPLTKSRGYSPCGSCWYLFCCKSIERPVFLGKSRSTVIETCGQPTLGVYLSYEIGVHASIGNLAVRPGMGLDSGPAPTCSHQIYFRSHPAPAKYCCVLRPSPLNEQVFTQYSNIIKKS